MRKQRVHQAPRKGANVDDDIREFADPVADHLIELRDQELVADDLLIIGKQIDLYLVMRVRRPAKGTDNLSKISKALLCVCNVDRE
jgi:hypothetical protein